MTRKEFFERLAAARKFLARWTLCLVGIHDEYASKRRWRNMPKFSASSNGGVWVSMACHRCKWRGLMELK